MARSYVDIINDENMTWQEKKDLINSMEKEKEQRKIERENKKLFKETLEELMGADVDTFYSWFDEVHRLNSKYENGVIYEPNEKDCQNYFKMKGIKLDIQTAMMLCTIQKAMAGSVKHAEFVRDTMGQKPVQEVKADINMAARQELAELAKLLGE